MPLIDNRRVSNRSRTILELVPEPDRRRYRLEIRQGVDGDTWDEAERGTVVRDGEEFLLVHNPGDGKVRVRIANRAKGYLYCVEVQDPNTGWRVPLAPSWVISHNLSVVAKLLPNPGERRFDIEVVQGASNAEIDAAAKGTVADGTLRFEVDGQRHATSIEAIRGEVRLRSRYTSDEAQVRDEARYQACRNRYSDTAANNLRPWGKHDIIPRADDVFRERLYAVQWIRPDGSIFFTGATEDNLAREHRVEAIVRDRLIEWQTQGLLPAARIEPGYNTTQPIRERGWTHWHHLFTPRHLLIGAMMRPQVEMADERLRPALALSFCRLLDYLSKLTQWRSFRRTESLTGGLIDFPNHVFYNQALNTFFNFGAKTSYSLPEGFSLETKFYPIATERRIDVIPAHETREPSDLWITDPPYADAINYHEITEYFIAWLAKAPPRDDWVWDSLRAFAIRGESSAFRRSMVEAYSAMARHMPDNGFQVVMFTHQDVGVWADLAEILWAAGLQVTAGWCVATETESATRVGNYVQGTVLLVLRKRLGNEAGFLARLQRPVEEAVREQLKAMRQLDDGEDPNFGDADYQLAAYAAALKVLTRYATIDGRPVAAEVLRERRRGEVSEVERLLRRAVRLASDFLVPEGLAREVWDELGPEERLFVKGLELEQNGETRSAAYQEMARGFGVEDYGALLASARANAVRLKTAKEFGRRDLKRAGSQDRAEDRALEAFAGGLVRHALYGIHVARTAEDLRAALDWFHANLPDYWQHQPRLGQLLDYLGSIRTAARTEEAATARALRGAVENDRP